VLIRKFIPIACREEIQCLRLTGTLEGFLAWRTEHHVAAFNGHYPSIPGSEILPEN